MVFGWQKFQYCTLCRLPFRKPCAGGILIGRFRGIITDSQHVLEMDIAARMQCADVMTPPTAWNLRC